MNVRSSFIHSSPKLKLTQTSIKNKGINKTWYIHTKDYYSEVKERSRLLIDTTTWMNLKISRQNERSQTKISSQDIITFILNLRKCKLIYSYRNWSPFAWGLEQKGGCTTKGQEIWWVYKYSVFDYSGFFTGYIQMTKLIKLNTLIQAVCYTYIMPQWNWYPPPKKNSAELCLQFIPRVKPKVRKKSEKSGSIT